MDLNSPSDVFVSPLERKSLAMLGPYCGFSLLQATPSKVIHRHLHSSSDSHASSLSGCVAVCEAAWMQQCRLPCLEPKV